MSGTRELFLISPFRLPTHATASPGEAEILGFLNGYSALWHPAALAGAAGPPRIVSPSDHERPAAGCLYALPHTPPLFLPEDWEENLSEVNSAGFRAETDRAVTLQNLEASLGRTGDGKLEGLLPQQIATFLAVGFGFLQIQALFEAMGHENALAAGPFWERVQQAAALALAGQAPAWRRPLQAAAEQLLAAREAVYPVTIHLLDLRILDADGAVPGVPPLPDEGLPWNLMATGGALERLAREDDPQLAKVRERVQRGQIEICGACDGEQTDELLPLESQLWNLREGIDVARRLAGADVRVFARKDGVLPPRWEEVLGAVGLHRALGTSLDGSATSRHAAPVVRWQRCDGGQMEVFTRTPLRADEPQTYFHLARHLYETIMHDATAVVSVVHAGKAVLPWYGDWLELSRLAPVLGRWTTVSRYLDEAAAEEIPPPEPDEHRADLLSRQKGPYIVSQFARHARLRRSLDGVWTLAGLYRAATGNGDALQGGERLAELERRVERGEEVTRELAELGNEAASRLGERLVARGVERTPGYLALNPCGFARRVSVELEEAVAPPVGGPVKAVQDCGGRSLLVVEVPAFGFAWWPRVGEPAVPEATPLVLADTRRVRNEYFEAEVDPETGGLRGLWDHVSRVSRLGQQLVWHPGSRMRVSEIRTTSTGPALGEIVSEGILQGDAGQVLATFEQRFRAWLGRPVLELRLKIRPERRPEGNPWDAYFGARFAWRDERAALRCGVLGPAYATEQARLTAPEYLECGQGRQRTVILPGGLPFWQRHGGRMVDVVLIPPGEEGESFELGVALDRDYPMQTALGFVTPTPVVVVPQGPPPVGPVGWLLHLDLPNVAVTSLRPVPGQDAVVATLLETGRYSGRAHLRCARPPRIARLVDAFGWPVGPAEIEGDAVAFEIPAGGIVHAWVDFR